MTLTPPDAEKTARRESGAPFTPRPAPNEPQFTPGTVVAGRYRISSILGKGGMGEVYRADDIKLGQTVALKFLPARRERDPAYLERLHDEVRLGRQVTHPNVCRIYDIGEWNDAHFVAMEYVDGEDLARLLHRIGRLPHDKAVDITRGIAAGLLAAHAKGILHRDLKPANVMLDSHGDARIMDFGLALTSADDSQNGVIAGTPAYMAPEQFEGNPATVQSDLYALGLVMYELFTGKRAHGARTLPERVRDSTSEITTPSSVIRDIDPLVERLILRCLSNDPAQRPRSAREVIAALPGGDPLAAAMAAGETPSPRVVAAAGTEGSLSRAAAWSLLAVTVGLFALLFFIREERSLGRYAPPAPSPEVLHDRAISILRTFGVPAEGNPIPKLLEAREYGAWLVRNPRWEALRHGPALLTYRLEYGVSRIESENMRRFSSGPGRTDVEIDAQGRLTHLIATPRGEIQPRPLDWNALLGTAGLDPRLVRPIPPRFAPPAPFDTLRAWSGTYPNDRTPIRVEATAWRGIPTFFRITGPWDDAKDPFAGVAFADASSGSAFFTLMSIIAIGVALLLAWRNLRLRRGDRQGAFRLAVVVFVCSLGANWLPRLSARRPGEALSLWEHSTGEALFTAAILYLFYIALEPVIRRRWPSLLIAWTRLLAGDLRNPMIGRDVMIAIIAGLAQVVLTWGPETVMKLLGRMDRGPEIGIPTSLLGIRFSIAAALQNVAEALSFGTLITVLLVLMLMILRRRSLAAAAFFALNLAGFLFNIAGDWRALPSVTLGALLFTLIVARYGLLAFVTLMVTLYLMFRAPHISASWSTPMMIIPYAMIALLALWAFRTSLGGQSLFREGVLGD